jgi:streptomycin 3"-adenylyltransferase
MCSCRDPRICVCRLGDLVLSCLGDTVTGIYVHGSAGTDAFIQGTSDLDLAVVCAEPGSSKAYFALAHKFAEIELMCCAPRIMIGVFTLDVASTLPPMLGFELWLAREADGTRMWCGNARGSDMFAVHFETCRQRGFAIYGPAPASVFSTIPRDRVLQALVRAETAYPTAPPHTAVLNSCRSWLYLETGILGTKLAGHAWALSQGHGEELVNQALAFHLGTSSIAPDEREARELTQWVQAHLTRAVAERELAPNRRQRSFACP